MNDTAEELLQELRDYDYAEGYAETLLSARIATQIKVLREQQEMKQTELASLMGTTQTVISRIENVNYSSWSIKTLKKIARAFKLRLKVSFESFGTLPDELEGFTKESLERPRHDQDPMIWDVASSSQGEKVRSSLGEANRALMMDPPLTLGELLHSPPVFVNDEIALQEAYSVMPATRKGPTRSNGTAHAHVKGAVCQTN